jgi:hypothetical protein
MIGFRRTMMIAMGGWTFGDAVVQSKCRDWEIHGAVTRK